MLLLKFIAPIPWKVRRIMREIVAAAQGLDIRHKVPVYVAPAMSVGSSDRCGLAAFVLMKGRPSIWIGGHPPAEVMDVLPDYLRANFAHELAHYEQWRDGRPLQERGVAVHGRTIERHLRRSG